MAKYIISRFIFVVITFFAVLVLNLFILRMMPGDIIQTRIQELVLNYGYSYEQAYKIVESQLGYDINKNIFEQFLSYILNVFRGNLGESIIYRIPVLDVIMNSILWTIYLGLASLIFSFILGIVLGIVAAYNREKLIDNIITLFASLILCIPNFLIGIILLVLFGVYLGIFPLRGAYSIEAPYFSLEFFISVLKHSVLPILSYSLVLIGNWILVFRASAITVISENYILFAKAKGLKNITILFYYILPNAIIPIIPLFFISLGGIIQGAFFVEPIFGYPGIGYFFSKAITLRDYTLIQGILTVITLIILFLNFLADILHKMIDIRVKNID